MSSFMTLGLYQLENLVMARPSFRFLDVRMHPQIVSIPRVQAILATATVVSKTQVVDHLKNVKCGSDDPVVLLCEDGRLSHTVANELDSSGFKQIYLVEGGLDGLLREATVTG